MTEESNFKLVPSGKRGFASMTPEKRREIASKGGKSVKSENRTFSKNQNLAKRAGAKGGKLVNPDKRTFKSMPGLAAKAGRASAAARKKS